MNGLERELAALSDAVEWPDSPDLAPVVSGRLGDAPRRPGLARRPLAIAVAVVLAAVLAVLAVPPARTAILDWLGIGGARIVRVDDPALLKKLAGEATRIDRFAIDGDTAVWLEGGPHVVLFVAPDGLIRDDHGWLAGNTLLVDRDGTTVRVEGALDRPDAVDLVRAMPASPSSEG